MCSFKLLHVKCLIVVSGCIGCICDIAPCSSRLPPPAAVSSPLHPSPAPGVGGHVAGGPAGQRAGLRHGGGVRQHGVGNCTRASERGPEGSAPVGTQGAGEAGGCLSQSVAVCVLAHSFDEKPKNDDGKMIYRLTGG